MFENEQKYIIKTADDIRKIQEEIVKKRISSFHQFGIFARLLIVGAVLILSGLFIVIINIIPDEWILMGGISLTLPIWILVFLNAIQETYKSQIGIYYQKIDQLKKDYSAMLFTMSGDFQNVDIKPQQIIELSKRIKNTSDQIKEIHLLYSNIANIYRKWFATFWSVFFSKKLKEQMQSFFQIEGNQLLIYVNTFSQDLNFWTERHKMELSQLEENIDQQREETILPEGKLALELSQDRISRLTQEADMIRVAQK